MRIGDQIKTRRKELGLTAEYIAENLGLSPATVYRYESGDIAKPPATKLVKLAELLHTTPGALLGWEGGTAKGEKAESLVFLKPIGSRMEPYTTAPLVGEYARVQADTIRRLIQKHMKDLEEFGKVGFEISAIEGSRTGQRAKIYHLNEQQATLLVTYLKNTEQVRRFKKALVREFFAARRELAKRETERAAKAPVRRSLTDAIRDSGEAERMNGYAYNAYTNLIYKAVTGKNAALLRRSRGAGKGADVVGLLTSGELAAVARREAQVCALLDCGMTYDEIRAALLRKENCNGTE